MMDRYHRFYNEHDMQVRDSQRKLRRINRAMQKLNAWDITITDEAFYDNASTHYIEEVDCVEILMPKDRLKNIVDYIKFAEDSHEKHETDRQLIARFERDRLVRLKHPSVEKAYQKYVTLLELCRK